MYILQFIRGFCMALADSVPGVSGGTIAFLLGFYDNFIGSIDAVVSGKMEEKKKGIIFLLKLGIGWIIGFGLAVVVLTKVFENHIYNISSLFLGFILFAIPIVMKEEAKAIKGKYGNIIFIVIGIAIVSAITYFNPVSKTGGMSVDHLNLGLILYLFVAGAAAVSAMVLPGISGSTIILIMGLYVTIITGIKEMMTFNFKYVPILFCFGIGILAGVIFVIRFIKLALEKQRSKTIYLIIGLMLGSIYAIIMGPTTLDTPQAAMSLKTFSILFFVIGGVIVLGLQQLKNVLEKKN